jgi:hypothetical protein
MIRDTFRFHIHGEIIEVSVISGTNREWEACPQSEGKAYSVIRLANGRVRACKVILPSEILRPGGPRAPRDWLAEMMACPRVTDCPPSEIIATTKPPGRRRKND